MEDISSPRCFEIEEKLKEACDIPVFHDDQHGTAIVVAAALLNSLKLTGRKLEDVKVVLNGPGAAVVCTGSSDFPNQVNNVLVFPGLFRGALDARASMITEHMKIAAAYAIAGLIDVKELRMDCVLPSIFDERVKAAVSEAVRDAAVKDGVSRF